MNIYPLATRTQRVVAALLNMVIGALPISLPNMASSRGEFSESWSLAEVNLLTIALTLIQLTFVHLMQGSPGAVFAGLRVQNLDGTRPNIQTTVFRSIPYLAIVVIILCMELRGRTHYTGPLTQVLLLGLLFLGSSGITMLINGRHSIIDMLTKTEMVKAHQIG